MQRPVGRDHKEALAAAAVDRAGLVPVCPGNFEGGRGALEQREDQADREGLEASRGRPTGKVVGNEAGGVGLEPVRAGVGVVRAAAAHLVAERLPRV